MKIKKQKYIGRCDSYTLDCGRPCFDSFPIVRSYDYTPNGADHLNRQSYFIDDRLIDDSDETYKFRFCIKM